MNEPYYRRRVLSFKYAFEGIIAAFKEEPNLKIHFLIGLIVIFLGFLLQVSKIDWALLIILMGLVISLELTNASIEAVVDSFTDKQHPRAKLSKDISAGAVLIISIVAATCGILIFLPYFS